MVGEVLPDGWRWTTLGEVADPSVRAIVSGPFGSNIGSRFFVEEGVPVIRGNNLTTDMRRFVDDGFVFVTEEKADELGNCDAVVDDLIFTAAGSLGQVGLIPRQAKYPRYIISNKQLRARIDKTRVDPTFSFYWFASREMVEYIQQRNTGSSVPLINLSVLRSLPLPLPPLSEQRAIAHILGTLDDKIELNRRMNETLEAMARALFKSWFVDFDPVRAKAGGRDPGLPQPLADLFPDSFEDSELGEIPEGWTVQGFADTVEIIGGGTPKTSVAEYWDGDIPWFSVVDAPSGSEVWVVDTARKITREGVKNSSTLVLSVGTTIISARGTVGRIALVAVPMAMNQSCYALRGKVGTHGYFTYFATRELVTRLQQHAHGSVFDTITQDTLAGVSLPSPPAALIEAFETLVRPTLECIRAKLLGSRSLASMRDTLLPKLVSGELRVRNPERSSERVGA